MKELRTGKSKLNLKIQTEELLVRQEQTFFI
jgi:hypothetical protein